MVGTSCKARMVYNRSFRDSGTLRCMVRPHSRHTFSIQYHHKSLSSTLGIRYWSMLWYNRVESDFWELIVLPCPLWQGGGCSRGIMVLCGRSSGVRRVQMIIEDAIYSLNLSYSILLMWITNFVFVIVDLDLLGPSSEMSSVGREKLSIKQKLMYLVQWMTVPNFMIMGKYSYVIPFEISLAFRCNSPGSTPTLQNLGSSILCSPLKISVA